MPGWRLLGIHIMRKVRYIPFVRKLQTIDTTGRFGMTNKHRRLACCPSLNVSCVALDRHVLSCMILSLLYRPLLLQHEFSSLWSRKDVLVGMYLVLLHRCIGANTFHLLWARYSRQGSRACRGLLLGYSFFNFLLRNLILRPHYPLTYCSVRVLTTFDLDATWSQTRLKPVFQRLAHAIINPLPPRGISIIRTRTFLPPPLMTDPRPSHVLSWISSKL